MRVWDFSLSDTSQMLSRAAGQRGDDLDTLTVVGWFATPVAAAIISWLAASLKEARRRSADHDSRRDEEHAALVAGMRELMRRELYDMHTRYVVGGEPMSYSEKERADSVYAVYHALGGNGTGTHVHAELIGAYVGKGGEEK